VLPSYSQFNTSKLSSTGCWISSNKLINAANAGKWPAASYNTTLVPIDIKTRMQKEINNYLTTETQYSAVCNYTIGTWSR
jgi:hypothetical protein